MTCLAASKRTLSFFGRLIDRYLAWCRCRALERWARSVRLEPAKPLFSPPGPLLRLHREYHAFAYLPALDLRAFPPDLPDLTNDRVVAVTYGLTCIAPPRRPYIPPMSAPTSQHDHHPD